MDEIPDDIWEKALALANQLSIHHSDEERLWRIARAILAERERCAKIAEDHGKAWGLAMSTPATVIATAIRSGVEDGRG